MLTKDSIISTIKDLDEPIFLDDVLERMILIDKIQTGLEQSKKGQVISEVELEERIESW